MESKATAVAMRFMCFPLVQKFVQAFVVERAGHPGELVAELSLVRGHAVRVESLARAPYLEDGEVVGAVGLLHDFEADAPGPAAVRIAERLERDDGGVLLRRGRDGAGQ